MSLWLTEKWLTVLSIFSTMLFSLVGFPLLAQGARWSVDMLWANAGASLPSPTQYIVDLAYHPMSLNLVPALIPLALCVFGARLASSKHLLIAQTFLMFAPQLVLLELITGAACIFLPLFSIGGSVK